jgi:DNA-directed RNA polymerase subunit beta'
MANDLHTQDFDAISLTLASPERVLEWSFGEVTKPETINYRTQRPEKNGLFDEKIFGPEKDFECYCGKYRGIRYKGIVCEKCGVEITRSIVRRERMGHIELAVPVSHIWFLRGIPSRISLLLGISSADVEKVIYFAGYIITDVNDEEKKRILKDLDAEYKSKLKTLTDTKSKENLKEMLSSTKQEIESIQPGTVVDEGTYHKYAVKYGTMFEADVGAEAIYNIFKDMDLESKIGELEEQLEKAGTVERDRINKRLALMKDMHQAGVRPEWMFLVRMPVIPPALRPMIALDGGRHATSDINDLYRRVINRNNRLKKLMDISAPDVILRNEKRILQEAVDSLIDNSIRHGQSQYSAMSQQQRRPLKSLADYLKGKQGYFRQNLLGKRVDYSGRSVIVIGPDLKLDQCGLPKHMALELFKPFVIAKLLEKELAFNIRGANRLIEEGIPEVWAILEEVIQDKHVLLNRAPTLHRQGIQAFRPVLIEGNAIQIHPLVCPAFNADFDGDQMAVHVPLSEEAQLESAEVMSANKNVLKPGSGEVVTTARQDIIMGIYWMTKLVPEATGEGKYFPSPNNAITAYDYGLVDFRAAIRVLPGEGEKYEHFGNEPFETSVGRLLLNSVLPSDFPFVNEELSKKKAEKLVEDLVSHYGLEQMPKILNKLKDFGFRYATRSGITFGKDDVLIPEKKDEIIDRAKQQQQEIIDQYNEGLLSRDERSRQVIDIWHAAKGEIEELIPETLDKNGSVYDMWQSGARGSLSQITQVAGMKGLITNPRGEVIDFPIVASMKEGLTPIEYFTTTHGSRKGLADTALQTAKAGYLTRRLFDVAQDAIVTEADCKTKEATTIRKVGASGIEISIAQNVRGRVLAADVTDPNGTVLYKKGHFVTDQDAQAIEDAGVEEVQLRTPMGCKSTRGICQLCYGMDLTTNEQIDVGEAVGTVAAQAIGEPGTQLTMRTFHAGGAASAGGDITQGLPRVEEVFEKRSPKNSAVVARTAGTVTDVREESNGDKIIEVLADAAEKRSKSKTIEYRANFRRTTLVHKNDRVEKGDLLTDGSADIDELFKYAGKERTQEYIINEINKVYELQGATISRKHIEVIIKQMFSRKRVKDPGDTTLATGQIVEVQTLQQINEQVEADGGEPAVGELLVLGITDVSLTRQSFLSASSFQNTTKVLISAAVRGATDELAGLKENVIIGRLIPAGSGFTGSEKHEMIRKLNEQKAQEAAESGAAQEQVAHERPQEVQS